MPTARRITAAAADHRRRGSRPHGMSAPAEHRGRRDRQPRGTREVLLAGAHLDRGGRPARLHHGRGPPRLGRARRRDHRDRDHAAQGGGRLARLAAHEPRRPRRLRLRLRARLRAVPGQPRRARAVRPHRLRPPRREPLQRGDLLHRLRRPRRVPVRHLRLRLRHAGLGRRADRAREGLRGRVRGEHRPAARPHRRRERRPRHGRHARRARRRQDQLPRLLLRHLPRHDVRRAVPREGRQDGAGWRGRPVGERPRRARVPDGRLRERPARVRRRLPGEQPRLPVPR